MTLLSLLVCDETHLRLMMTYGIQLRALRAASSDSALGGVDADARLPTSEAASSTGADWTEALARYAAYVNGKRYLLPTSTTIATSKRK